MVRLGEERAWKPPAHCRMMTAASIRVKSPGGVRREMIGPEFRSVFAGDGGCGDADDGTDQVAAAAAFVLSADGFGQ